MCQIELCPSDTDGVVSEVARNRKSLLSNLLVWDAEFGIRGAQETAAGADAEPVAGPVAANRSRRRAGQTSARRYEPDPHRISSYMKATPSQAPQEPMGIIISPGARQDLTPARFAYVWAPPPDEKGDEGK